MPVLQGSSLLDAIQRPMDTVRSLFDQANQPVRDTANDWGVEQYFKEVVSDPFKRQQVPLLTPETADQIPNHSLCRFQGMVQDMMDPEYYIGAFKQPGSNWQTTKYSDNSCEVVGPNAETVVWDRKPLYCTRVPGQSQWVVSPDASMQLPVNLGGTGAAAKRGRDAEVDDVMEDASVESAGHAKVARTSEGSENVANETDSSTSPDRLAPQKGDCIVFVYERNESLKLNDMVEFVGVLSRMPELAATQMRETEADANGNHLGFIDEELAARPPTSLVPRMHAITAIKLKGTEDLPIIAYKGSKERQAQVAELRATALSLLQTALGGDRLAAEYLLLQMVSRIYCRTESTALGALSLGLTNCPSTPVSISAGGTNGKPGSLGNPAELSQFGRMVAAALATLVPRVIGLPISIDKLNGSSWRPARDVKTNRLLRAPLQLADNTHVVLDEALLQAGQLTALGVNNLKALKDLLDNKKIEYDFSFYTLPMSADVPVTVLSSGKSLLHTSLDVVLPLHPTAPLGTLEHIQAWSEKEELRAVRAYIGLVRDLSFTIQQPMTSFLENELTAARQRDSSVSTSTMHTWLTVARLLALSHGEDELIPERWAQMRELEHSREQRLRAGK